MKKEEAEKVVGKMLSDVVLLTGLFSNSTASMREICDDLRRGDWDPDCAVEAGNLVIERARACSVTLSESRMA